MKLIATADIHANHPGRGTRVDALIDQINSSRPDALLLIGDTAVFDGRWIEETLSRFKIDGPKLFVPGNHEMWSNSTPVEEILTRTLRERVERAGWHYLPGTPMTLGATTIVGSMGWYDYGFALDELQIPIEFYEAHVAPGSARFVGDPILAARAGELPASSQIVARWNDRRLSVEMPGDRTMLERQLDQLDRDLRKSHGDNILAAIHVVPTLELMPPRVRRQLDFARAYLGSPAIGLRLSQDPRVRRVVCGHSHWPMSYTDSSGVIFENVGSGYREKRWITIEI